MPRIPIFKIGHRGEAPSPLKLARYAPHLVLEQLSAGIDNLRHDVYLSPKFVEQMRLQIARLLARHGNVERVLSAEILTPSVSSYAGLKSTPRLAKADPAEIKP